MNKNFCYWLSESLDFRNDKNMFLYTLANNFQDLECILYDGYPNVYSQLRAILESSVNFFLKFHYNYDWKINSDDGWDYERVMQFINSTEYKTQKSFMIKAYKEFPLHAKIILFLKEKPEFNWLSDITIKLNPTSHGIVTMCDVNMKEVFERLFYYLKVFYNLYYEMTTVNFKKTIPKNYKMPSDNDLKQIVEKYNARTKSYIN